MFTWAQMLAYSWPILRGLSLNLFPKAFCQQSAISASWSFQVTDHPFKTQAFVQELM